MERATTFDIMDQQKQDKLMEMIGAFAIGMWQQGSTTTTTTTTT